MIVRPELVAGFFSYRNKFRLACLLTVRPACAEAASRRQAQPDTSYIFEMTSNNTQIIFLSCHEHLCSI
jgi:hypothetical protein